MEEQKPANWGYQPLTMDHALQQEGLSSFKFWGLFAGWVLLIGLSISSVFIVEHVFGFTDVLNQDKIGQVFLIQIPMLIGMLLVLWLGFEWGFIPVFLSTFVLAFTASMAWYWSLLYSLSFTLGLSIYALSYYCVNFDVSLRSLKSFTYYVIVSLFAALACSLGAFVWSRFYGLPLFETLIIWKSWWVSLFLQSFLITGPLLFFLTPWVYRVRDKWFKVPKKEEVSLKWIYSAITTIVVVLVMFIISAKLLGSQSIEREISNLGINEQVFTSMMSVNESFEIVTWISISLVFFIGIGSIYLVGSWNQSLKDQVDMKTQALQENEIMLNSALDERDHLLNEIHDRVKTNLTMVLAVVELQIKNYRVTDNQEILKNLHSLLRALTIIHETMSQTKKTNHVDLKNYAIKLSNRIGQALRKEKKDIQIKVSAVDGLELEMNRAIPFALIINELVMNACNYGFKEGDAGVVKIDLKKTEHQFIVKVIDNGHGLPDDFDKRAATGIGLRIVRAFSKQLNARLEYSSNDTTTFKLTLDLEEKDVLIEDEAHS
jgi:two-component sensor histidine kinase